MALISEYVTSQVLSRRHAAWNVGHFAECNYDGCRALFITDKLVFVLRVYVQENRTFCLGKGWPITQPQFAIHELNSRQLGG